MLVAEEGLKGLMNIVEHPDLDLIIVDYALPHMNGLEVIKQIRSRYGNRVPVILLHGISDSVELAEECNRAGVCAMLTKPVNANVLHTMLLDIDGFMKNGLKHATTGFTKVVDAQLLGTSSKRVVLIAEDIHMNMILAKTLLKQILGDVTILEANDGMQVLDVLRNQQVDLILMDVQMPGMDGLLATRGVREMEQGTGRRVPIIALTAGALSEERDRCMEAGMDDFLTKPIELKSLSAKVKEYV